VRTIVWRTLRPYRWTVVIVFTLSLISGMLEIGVIAMVAMLAGRLLNTSPPVAGLDAFSDYQLVFLTLGITLVKVVVDLMLARLQAGATLRYEGNLRRQFAELQANCRWAAIEDADSGSIHSLLWTSVHRSRDGFAQAITLMASSANLAIMLVATVVTVRWMVVPLLAGLLVFWVSFRPLIRASHRASGILRDAYNSYGRELLESIAMSREARVLGVQDRLAERQAVAGERAAKAASQQSFYSSLMTYIYSDAVYLLAAIGFGIIFVLQVDNPAPLAAIVLLLYRSMGYGRSVQSAIQNMHNAEPFVVDVEEWIQRLSQDQESRSMVAARWELTHFESVQLNSSSLRYSNGHLGVADLSLEIRHGETIALVGPSGSGKSSLVSILLMLRDLTSGQMLINGKGIDFIDRTTWRSRLAFVPQDNLLFDDTIEENVRCWRDIDDARIIEVLRLVNMLDEVERMDMGLSTRVGEGGKRLSGGQRQRICLARALAGQPDLLILDEPTSALDPLSEHAVKDALSLIKGSVAMLIVAHRMTTISICDRILVLEEGRLVHDGDRKSVVSESDYLTRALRLSE